MHSKYAYFELKELSKVYFLGLEVLQAIQERLEQTQYGIIFEEVDKNEGELFFWLAGIGLYARIKVINGKDKYIGKVTWGRYLIEGVEYIRQYPVCENVYEQHGKDKYWLWYKRDDIDVPYDLSEDRPELLFDNVWKMVEDLFPETDEEPPARPGGIRIEV